VVYIHPLNNGYQQATVGVLPFQVPAGVSAEQGLRTAALFKDVLLGKRVFPVVRQLTEPYGNLEEALKLGRAAGVELVMAGRVDHLLATAEPGGGRVSVSLRLLDTTSGQTVWYVAQSMSQEVEYPDLSFGNRLRSSFSTPPVRQAAGPSPTVAMLTHLAFELAEVLQ
jgi:TolB-like protein